MLEYYKKEVYRIVEKVKQIRGIRFSFLHATDMHVDFKENRDVVMRQYEAMVELSNETNIDCIILGGDIIHGIHSKESSLEDLGSCVKEFSKANVPTYISRGNHDDNAYHNDPWIPPYDNKRVPHKYVIWDYEWTRIILEPLAMGNAVHDAENPESSYYYVDYPKKKIRIIFLDAYACPDEKNGDLAVWVSEGWDRFSDRQLKWFAETALDTTKEGWDYILCSHGPLIDGFVTGPCANASIVLDMVTSFNQKKSYQNKALDVRVDYSTAKSNVPLHVFGHTHLDGYHYDETSKLWMINTGVCHISEYDCSLATVEYCASPKRERGTITEALFDVIVYTEDGTIHRIRFGAGEDQQFNIK
ncbi:MAG: metallophosphoesterase [Tyzzerella sp.]|nr:metallophosphoesterase [Tyzzerella sp.]